MRCRCRHVLTLPPSRCLTNAQAYLQFGCFIDVRQSYLHQPSVSYIDKRWKLFHPFHSSSSPAAHLTPRLPPSLPAQLETGTRASQEQQLAGHHGFSSLDMSAASAITVSWICGRLLLFGWMVREQRRASQRCADTSMLWLWLSAVCAGLRRFSDSLPGHFPLHPCIRCSPSRTWTDTFRTPKQGGRGPGRSATGCRGGRRP